MLKRARIFLPEIIILSFAFFVRFWRLGFPPSHYFDEVYHAFTAQQMARGNPAAWEWWNTSPQGFAYEWTHPPLAKEFMWFAISVLRDNPFAWRFFSALFGFGTIILIYFIVLSLFKNRKIALFSSAVASFDGLLLVMSRIAMNDSYFLFFSLLAILLFLKNKNLLMGIALGLAIASKWTGLFTGLAILVLFLVQNYRTFNNFKMFRFLFSLFIVPLIIYLAAYTPFFLGHHSPPGQNASNLKTFIGLQQQMYWYHTRLKATHAYQSTPLQWIFDLRPVWLFVDYKQSLRPDSLKPDSTASIFTLDDPLIAWFGLVSIIFLIIEIIKDFSVPKFFIIFSYFIFFIFWIKSPRIMFNYHYLPSTAFLTIAIGYVINELSKTKNGKTYVAIFFLALIVSFVYFYPIWAGVHLPKNLYDSHFWLTSWK